MSHRLPLIRAAFLLVGLLGCCLGVTASDDGVPNLQDDIAEMRLQGADSELLSAAIDSFTINDLPESLNDLGSQMEDASERDDLVSDVEELLHFSQESDLIDETDSHTPGSEVDQLPAEQLEAVHAPSTSVADID